MCDFFPPPPALMPEILYAHEKEVFQSVFITQPVLSDDFNYVVPKPSFYNSICAACVQIMGTRLTEHAETAFAAAQMCADTPVLHHFNPICIAKWIMYLITPDNTRMTHIHNAYGSAHEYRKLKITDHLRCRVFIWQLMRPMVRGKKAARIEKKLINML